MYVLMQGPPGSGKTFFAETFAEVAGIPLYQITGAEITVPKDAFFRYNIPKMAQKIGAYDQTQLWQAVIASRYAPTALLFDEADKAPANIDGALLQLLDTNRCFFQDPYGEPVHGNAKNLFVFFTTNGERGFSEALCRRMHTTNFPAPDHRKFRAILDANHLEGPEGLKDYVTKLSVAMREIIKRDSMWPTPPEAMRLIKDVMDTDTKATGYEYLVQLNFSKNMSPDAWTGVAKALKLKLGSIGAALKTERER
jgi:MoxR-like ATPase